MELPASIKLYPYQKDALKRMHNGCVLAGGVGSGKSITSLAYVYEYVVDYGMDLYIITTAKKRDSLEWEGECLPFRLSNSRDLSINNRLLTVDSWNNIGKYTGVKNAVFIFDEQRIVGYGSWVKSFLTIAKSNKWILLSATPGDVWLDYVPIFVANNFYKNKSHFINKHVVFDPYSKYPKIKKYYDIETLKKLRDSLIVPMEYEKANKRVDIIVKVDHDKDFVDQTIKRRWNPFKEKPFRTQPEIVYTTRKIINSHESRLEEVKKLAKQHNKLIIFYNYTYELEILRELDGYKGATLAEWNSQKHQAIPETDKWIYLVQYSAGAEGWNCVETNALVFYSMNYSYRMVEQAKGRIDRVNSKWGTLFYYTLKSDSQIDDAVARALAKKTNFNEDAFAKKTYAIIERKLLELED